MAAGIPLLPFLAPVLSAWLTPHTLAIQAPSAIGTYVLATAGTHQLPIEAARIMPYEGPTLHSVHLELMPAGKLQGRSEEHTSELQSHHDLVCRLLLEKKKYTPA